MWDFFYFLPMLLVNRRGSLLLPTTGLTVSTTAATFNLPAYRVSGARGTMLIKISQEFPDGATATLPIVFSANGGTQAATKVGGDPLTIADIPGTGVYEFYYDRTSGTLQLLGTASSATAATQG
jgi:hypothetical protein